MKTQFKNCIIFPLFYALFFCVRCVATISPAYCDLLTTAQISLTCNDKIDLEKTYPLGFYKKSTSIPSRETIHFGTLFPQLEDGKVVSVPLPEFLEKLRERTFNQFKKQLEQYMPEDFDNCIITLYRAGNGIAPHTDHNEQWAYQHNAIYYFDDPVIGLIIEPDTKESLYFEDPTEHNRFYLKEKSGTAFLMQGAIRQEWLHGLNPIQTGRISITFRKVIFITNPGE